MKERSKWFLKIVISVHMYIILKNRCVCAYDFYYTCHDDRYIINIW